MVQSNSRIFSISQGIVLQEDVHRKGGTVCAARSLMSLKNPQNRLDHVTGSYMNLSRFPAKFHRHFTILTSRIQPISHRADMTEILLKRT